jgi:hypothetical protein
MTFMASTIPLHMSFGAIASSLLRLIVPGCEGFLTDVDGNVVGYPPDAQRDDFGHENLPLASVSKFNRFELDVWMAKQCSGALQCHLVSGIKSDLS